MIHPTLLHVNSQLSFDIIQEVSTFDLYIWSNCQKIQKIMNVCEISSTSFDNQ